MKATFFPDGNTVIFDENKQQVPELQESWFRLYLQFLKEHGIDPTEVDFTMPDGSHAKPFEIEGGFNWNISV